MGSSWETPLSYGNMTDGDFASLRSALRGIGYDPRHLVADLGLGAVPDLYPLDYRLLPALVDRPDVMDGPRAAACRLLFLGLPVAARALRASLGDGPVRSLVGSGLVCEGKGLLHALLSIVPFEDLLVVTDKLFMNADTDAIIDGVSSDNAVWRLDRTTRIMSQALPRRNRGSVLELCCGSGALSLLAGRDAARVTGTDINTRAVNVARFNARLNGIGNAEFVRCDLAAGAGDARHALVFMNPPSAPGLVKAWNREGGSSGLDVVEAGIAAARPLLSDDGLFMTTLHLGYRTDRDILDWVVRHFPRDEYCTAVVRHSESWGAEEYSLNEALRKTGPRDFEAYQRTYRMYRAGLATGGIERIAFAVMAARRGGAGCELVTTDLYGTGWERALMQRG